VKVLGAIVLKSSFTLGVKGELGKLALVSSLATSSSLPFLVNSFSEQNRDRAACAFWSLPWEIQIFRGRWEAAERQLEPWWAVCHPVHHPLSPLWSGFLLLCRQHSLQVPGNMYPLENIYNLLTSWRLIFF
jgi:hypothetical protein